MVSSSAISRDGGESQFTPLQYQMCQEHAKELRSGIESGTLFASCLEWRIPSAYGWAVEQLSNNRKTPFPYASFIIDAVIIELEDVTWMFHIYINKFEVHDYVIMIIFREGYFK